MSLKVRVIIFELLKNLKAIGSDLVVISQHFGKDVLGEGAQVAREGNATLSNHL